MSIKHRTNAFMPKYRTYVNFLSVGKRAKDLWKVWECQGKSVYEKILTEEDTPWKGILCLYCFWRCSHLLFVPMGHLKTIPNTFFSRPWIEILDLLKLTHSVWSYWAHLWTISYWKFHLQKGLLFSLLLFWVSLVDCCIGFLFSAMFTKLDCWLPATSWQVFWEHT